MRCGDMLAVEDDVSKFTVQPFSIMNHAENASSAVDCCSIPLRSIRVTISVRETPAAVREIAVVQPAEGINGVRSEGADPAPQLCIEKLGMSAIVHQADVEYPADVTQLTDSAGFHEFLDLDAGRLVPEFEIEEV